MDVVSVNLSRADAALLLNVVDVELGGCGCVERSSRRCDRCEALGTIRSDLLRMLVDSRRRGTGAGLTARLTGSVHRVGRWPVDPRVVC